MKSKLTLFFLNCLFLAVFFNTNRVVAQTPVTFMASSHIVFPEDPVCVDISVMDFTDLLSLQFSINWDASVIAFSSLSTTDELIHFSSGNLGVDLVGEGKVTVAWFDLDLAGGTLPDSTNFITLCFDAIGDDGSMTSIDFTGDPTIIEVINTNTEALQFNGVSGHVSIDSEFFVLPGDTDRNLTANHFDLFNIGLGFGQTGAARAEAVLDFIPQFMEGWGSATPLSGVDYKHADANGNGMVNADDIIAIESNWGATINFRPNDNNEEDRHLMAAFFVDADTLFAGQSAVFDIVLGTEDNPATDVYSAGFSIHYDNNAVLSESVQVSFEDSWLGETDLISVQKDFFEEGHIDVAVSRTDQQNRSGSGKIGTVSMQLTEEVLMSESYLLGFSLENVEIISANEQSLEVIPMETEVVVTDQISSISDIENGITAWTIAPNPVNKHAKLSFELEEKMELEISVFNAVGQKVVVLMDNQIFGKGQQEVWMDVEDWERGVYFVYIENERGRGIGKLIVK